eukprot:7381491-Prymnesium_polylepis.1
MHRRDGQHAIVALLAVGRGAHAHEVVRLELLDVCAQRRVGRREELAPAHRRPVGERETRLRRGGHTPPLGLSLIHISEPTRRS